MTYVVCADEFVYNGVRRYVGEIFRLIGAPNDELLIKTGMVRIYNGDPESAASDDSGRLFVSEDARINARRQMQAAETSIVIRRGPGRPRKNVS